MNVLKCHEVRKQVVRMTRHVSAMKCEKVWMVKPPPPAPVVEEDGPEVAFQVVFSDGCKT